jgi:hypothetical protein
MPLIMAPPDVKEPVRGLDPLLLVERFSQGVRSAWRGAEQGHDCGETDDEAHRPTHPAK